MQYTPGKKVRVIGRVPGMEFGDTLSPAELGWKDANVRAMCSQGLLEVITDEEHKDLTKVELGPKTVAGELFRVPAAGGKYIVVEGKQVSDLLLKAQADKLIEELRNEAGQQNTG